MKKKHPPKEQVVFDWKFQAHISGTWKGWGFSGGATLYKCINTSAIKEVISGKNGKTWFYPNEKSREEFNSESELRKFLEQKNQWKITS